MTLHEDVQILKLKPFNFFCRFWHGSVELFEVGNCRGHPVELLVCEVIGANLQFCVVAKPTFVVLVTDLKRRTSRTYFIFVALNI
jgi:hypothetical protein